MTFAILSNPLFAKSSLHFGRLLANKEDVWSPVTTVVYVRPSPSLLRDSPGFVRSTCVLVYLERSPISTRSRVQPLSVAPLIKCPFNKNRKPDERQREETWGGGLLFRWGVGEEEKEERNEEERGVGRGVLDPDRRL